MADCILCGNSESTIILKDYDNIHWYNCHNCGDFIVTSLAEPKVRRNKSRCVELSEKSKECRNEGFYLKIRNSLDILYFEVLSEKEFNFEVS